MGRIATRDAVQVYLNEIGQIPLLTALQEQELGRKIQEWLALPDPLMPRSPVEKVLMRQGQRAKSKLISSNLRLVVSIAKRYTNRGLDLLDLIQEGNLGLDRAADKFNPALGYKFSTYATWWIRQGVVRGLANQGRTIRLPVQMVERVRKLRQASSRLTAELGRTPTVEELAEELEITADGVWVLMRHTRTPRSLDAYVVSRSHPAAAKEDRLMDVIPDPGNSSQEFWNSLERRDYLEQLMVVLSPKEKYVISRRYGLMPGDRRLVAIGNDLKLTRERVRQIERRALDKMRAIAQDIA